MCSLTRGTSASRTQESQARTRHQPQRQRLHSVLPATRPLPPLPTPRPAPPTTLPPTLAMMAAMAATRTAAAFATRQVITSGYVHVLQATTALAAVCSLTRGTSALPSRQHRQLIRRRGRRPIPLPHLLPRPRLYQLPAPLARLPALYSIYLRPRSAHVHPPLLSPLHLFLHRPFLRLLLCRVGWIKS